MAAAKQLKLKRLLVIVAALLPLTAFAWQAGEQEPRQKLRVTWAVIEGFLEHKVEPVSPLDANGKPMHGNVQLRININRQGSVWNAVRVSGEPELADAAINAVKQWKFRPYLLNGKPVEIETAVKLDVKTHR